MSDDAQDYPGEDGPPKPNGYPSVMITNFCISPLECNYLSQEDVEVDKMKIVHGPGVVLILNYLIATPMGLGPDAMYVDIPRDMVKTLRDGLTEWLEDGHHVHGNVLDNEVVRQTNTHAGDNLALDAVPLDIPDTLDGLVEK